MSFWPECLSIAWHEISMIYAWIVGHLHQYWHGINMHGNYLIV